MKLIEHHGLRAFQEISRDLESLKGYRALEMTDVSYAPNTLRRRSIQLTLKNEVGTSIAVVMEWHPDTDTYYLKRDGECVKRTREFMLSFFNIHCDALDEKGEVRSLLALDKGGRERVLRTLRARYFDVLSPIGIDIFKFPFLDEAHVHPNTRPIIGLLKRTATDEDEDPLSCKSVEASGFFEPVNLSDPNLLPQFEQALASHLRPKLKAQDPLIFLPPQPSPFLMAEEDMDTLRNLYRDGTITYEVYQEKMAYCASAEFMFHSGEIELEKYIEMAAVDAIKINGVQKVGPDTALISYQYTAGSGSSEEVMRVKTSEWADILPYIDERGRAIEPENLGTQVADIDTRDKYADVVKKWEVIILDQIKRCFVRHNPHVFNMEPEVQFEGITRFNRIDFLSQDAPLSSVVRFSDGEHFAELQYDLVRGNYFVFHQGIRQRITQKGMQGYLQKLKARVSEEQFERIMDHLFLSPSSSHHLAKTIQSSLCEALEKLRHLRLEVPEPTPQAEDLAGNSLVLRINRKRENMLAWARQAAAALLLMTSGHQASAPSSSHNQNSAFIARSE